MKHSRFLLSAVAMLLCIATLASCGAGTLGAYTQPAETEPLFNDTVTDDIATDSVDPDEIVYPEGEIPKIYITTPDGKQVTSKNVYSTCNIRLEMNDVFEEYQSTYTDENGGGASIRCRGNMTYNIADAKKWNMYSTALWVERMHACFGDRIHSLRRRLTRCVQHTDQSMTS